MLSSSSLAGWSRSRPYGADLTRASTRERRGISNSKSLIETSYTILERKSRIYEKLNKGGNAGLPEKQYGSLLVDVGLGESCNLLVGACSLTGFTLAVQSKDCGRSIFSRLDIQNSGTLVSLTSFSVVRVSPSPSSSCLPRTIHQCSRSNPFMQRLLAQVLHPRSSLQDSQATRHGSCQDPDPEGDRGWRPNWSGICRWTAGRCL